MRIIAFGDVHMRPERAENIPDIETADCVVLTGDLTVHGGTREALQVLQPLEALNRPVYAQIGNMDTAEIDTLLTEKGINLHGRGVVMGEVGLFGVGGSTPTPFGTPCEFSEQELAGWLQQGFERVKGARTRILFSHTPPIRTALDCVRPGLHAGSEAVREFLERNDIQVCICGHIHEAVGTDRVGNTLIANPGMLSQGGYARIECQGDKVTATVEKC